MSDKQGQEPVAATVERPRRRRGFPPRKPVNRPLTLREQRFVDEYLLDLKTSQAAVRAGYKDNPASISVTAARLLGKANIQAALDVAYRERQTRTQVTADTTVREIGRLAFSDPAEIFDDDGNLISIKNLPAEVRACIASIEVVRRNVTSGAGKQERVLKIKWWSKPAALELLAKHLGMLREEAQQPIADCPAFCLPPGTLGVSVH